MGRSESRQKSHGELIAVSNCTGTNGGSFQFLLYQDEVKKVEIAEDAWEIDESEQIPDEQAVGFTVDTRTVIGTIENIQEGTFIVNTGRLSSTYIVPENFPNLKWKFDSGDVVSLTHAERWNVCN